MNRLERWIFVKSTNFERWFLRRWIMRRIIQADGYPNHGICDLYKMIYQAARERFPEDNAPTLDTFLREQFMIAAKDMYFADLQKRFPK